MSAFYREHIVMARLQARRLLDSPTLAESVAVSVVLNAPRWCRLGSRMQQARWIFRRVTWAAICALKRRSNATPCLASRDKLPASQLRDALGQAGIQEGMALACHYLDGMPVDEIAAVLGRSRMGLRYQLRRWRGKSFAVKNTDCLSVWRLSLFAANIEEPTPHEAGHLQKCLACRLRRADETQLRRAALDEGVPARPYRTRRLPLLRWLAGAVALLAAFHLHAQRSPPTANAQGRAVATRPDVEIFASVVRDGHFVVDEQPLPALTNLQEGDQLRLHIAHSQNRFLKLDAFEDGHWHKVYVGTMLQDLVLPRSIILHHGQKNALRVRVCRSEAQRENCGQRTYEL